MASTTISTRHAMLSLELLGSRAPFEGSTWVEFAELGLSRLGELNQDKHRLSSQAESDLEALDLWLRTTGDLPLRASLNRSTLAALDRAIGPVPAGPAAEAMVHMLDDPLVMVLHASQADLEEVEQRLVDWAERYDPESDNSASLIDEVQAAMHPAERDRAIAIAHRGLRAPDIPTLDQLGSKYGFTRERARQLELRAIRKLTAPVRAFPLVHLAYRTLWEAGEPLPLGTWLDRIPEQFRPANKLELRTVRALGDWTGTMPITWFVHEQTEWAMVTGQPEDDIVARLGAIASKIRRLTRRFAAPPSLGAIPESDHHLALTYLHGNPERFVQTKAGWWVTRAESDPKGAAVVRKILGTLGPLSLEELRGGLQRVRVALGSAPHRRLQVPTDAELRDLLKAAGFEVKSDVVSLGRRKPGRRPGKVLKAIIAAFQESGPILSYIEIFDLVASKGVDRARLGQVLARSPMLKRVGRGQYMLRGTEAAEGVEEVEFEVRDAPQEALIESHRLKDKSIVLGWRVDPIRACDRHPLGEYSPPEGRYYLMLDDKRVRVWVEGRWVRGLRRLESVLRRYDFREMRVRFKPGQEEVIALQERPQRYHNYQYWFGPIDTAPLEWVDE